MNVRHLSGSLALALALAASAFAQGGLTPAGAPSASMKRLDQVEPRTDLATLPGDASAQIVISQPGSYFLSSNLTGVSGKHGIRVLASDVTIDLGGFVLTGDANSNNGVDTSAARVSVRNGRLVQWNLGLRLAPEATLERVSVSDCRSHGVNVGDDSNVLDCSSVRNAGSGFIAGESTGLTRCNTRANGGTGIAAGSGAVLLQCRSATDVLPFSVGNASTVRDCTARGVLYGIYAGSSCVVAGCSVIGTGSNTGLYAGAGSAFTGCSVSNFATGIQASASTITGCAVKDVSNNGISASASTTSQCAVSYAPNYGIEGLSGGVITQSVATSGGIGFRGERGVAIDNCAAVDNRSHGMHIELACAVQNSVMANSQLASGLFGGSYSSISGNVFYGNASFGLQGATANLVRANVAGYNGRVPAYPGFYLLGDNVACDNLAFGNSSYGFNFDPVRDYVFRNAAMSNHGFVNAATSADYSPRTSASMGLVQFPGQSNVLPMANFPTP